MNFLAAPLQTIRLEHLQRMKFPETNQRRPNLASDLAIHYGGDPYHSHLVPPGYRILDNAYDIDVPVI